MLRESGGGGGLKFADDLLVAIHRQLATLHLQTGDNDSTGKGKLSSQLPRGGTIKLRVEQLILTLATR